MIRVSFFKSGGLLTGFECKGHSSLGEEGNDILCAFVSSACYMTANTVTEILSLDASAKDAGGYMRLKISGSPKKAQDILNGLRLHLSELKKQYPDEIEITLTEE